MKICPPVLLHYYITRLCNCRCAFCDIPRTCNDHQVQFADPNQVRHNLEQAKKMHIPFVDFTGGEPLLHPQLAELLRYAKKLGLHTSVTTNCLLYPQQAYTLKGLVDLLHFSLDALDESLHNRMRGNQVYNAVMHSIDLARQLGESPDLLYTVTDENIKELPYMAEFARQMKLILIINPVFIKPALAEQHLGYLEKFCHYPYVYLNQAFIRLRRHGGNSIAKPRCRAVSSTLVISPDNQILLPCYHYTQKKLPAPAALSEIYKDKTWREYHRMQGRFNFCQGCTINCYFDPSFLYAPDVYLLKSLAAKARYTWYKYFQNKFFYLLQNNKTKSAAATAQNINNQRIPHAI